MIRSAITAALLTRCAAVAFAPDDGGTIRIVTLLKPTFVDGSLRPPGARVDIDLAPGYDQDEPGVLSKNVTDRPLAEGEVAVGDLAPTVTTPQGLTLVLQANGTYLPAFTPDQVAAMMNGQPPVTPPTQAGDVAQTSDIAKDGEGGEGGGGEPSEFKGWTKDRLKTWLTDAKVTFETDANKDTLVKLVEDNQPKG